LKYYFTKKFKQDYTESDKMEHVDEVKEEPNKKAKVAKPKAAKPKAAKPKAAKPKVVKPKKCEVPSRSTKIESIRWMRHVYDMMIEAGVEITDEIIDLYNHLITTLKKYNQLSTGYPPKYIRYDYGIQLEVLQYSIRGLSAHFHSTVSLSEREEICKDILRAYQPLFDKIKDIVLPYMKKQYTYLNAQRELERQNAQLIKLHDEIERTMQEHQIRMNYMKNATISVEKQIAKLKEEIRINTPQLKQ